MGGWRASFLVWACIVRRGSLLLDHATARASLRRKEPRAEMRKTTVRKMTGGLQRKHHVRMLLARCGKRFYQNVCPRLLCRRAGCADLRRASQWRRRWWRRKRLANEDNDDARRSEKKKVKCVLGSSDCFFAAAAAAAVSLVAQEVFFQRGRRRGEEKEEEPGCGLPAKHLFPFRRRLEENQEASVWTDHSVSFCTL